MKVSVVMTILALGAFLVSCSGGGKSPADVSKSFIEKMEKGDIGGAYKLLDGTAEATEEESQKVKAFLGEGTKEIREKNGIKKIDVIEETISEDGKEANVRLNLTFGNGETDETTSKLKKTDEGWKISVEK